MKRIAFYMTVAVLLTTIQPPATTSWTFGRLTGSQ